MAVFVQKHTRSNEKEKLIEVVNNPIYFPNFLGNLDLKEPEKNVSVIVSTFNRSPHPIETGANPLGWCLESLLEQKKGGIGEIVVVDDGSTDYTPAQVDSFAEKTSIPIVYVKNDENLGSSISRNKGVGLSSHKYVQFLDDDCIFSPYMLFGAKMAFDNLPEDTAIVHQPIYHRSKKPQKLVDIANVGRLDLEDGIMLGNFNGFPREYYPEGVFMDENPKILKPFEIKNLGGVFLAKKEDFQEAQGFPDFFTWSNGYREETTLAMNISANNKKMFFTPDPKFHCTHLKYGAQSIKDEGGNYNGLSEFVQNSNVEMEDTGNRVSTKEWLHGYIASTYFTLGKGSGEAAEKFSNKIRQGFVDNNDYKVFATSAGVESDISYSERLGIYEKALGAAKDLLKGHK